MLGIKARVKAAKNFILLEVAVQLRLRLLDVSCSSSSFILLQTTNSTDLFVLHQIFTNALDPLISSETPVAVDSGVTSVSELGQGIVVW